MKEREREREEKEREGERERERERVGNWEFKRIEERVLMGRMGRGRNTLKANGTKMSEK